MHIFLTGENQAGKTSTLRSFLASSGKSADGFVTYWEPLPDGKRNLFLAPFRTDKPDKQRYLIAPDDGRGLVFSENTIRAFEEYGCEILNNCGKYDYIIMDELGFLETKAAGFRQAVMHHISGDVPILGVIKASQTDFLTAIRTHPKVIVREVTVENRNEVLTWLQSQNPYS
jgi:nucleoside-triphosphatase THEP1